MRLISCLGCFLPPHTSLLVLLRKNHAGPGSPWFTPVWGEEKGPESATGTEVQVCVGLTPGTPAHTCLCPVSSKHIAPPVSPFSL